jgi:hypothetical protein
MAVSNRERVTKALELLREGLEPLVERELAARLGDDWLSIVNQGFQRPLARAKGGKVPWDNQALLFAMDDHWNDVFKHVLSKPHRNMVIELKAVRNEWAHDRPFSFDQTYRALSTARLLLEAVSAAEPAREVHKLESDLMRTRFAEEARTETRRAVSVEGQPQAGLRPWREIVTPHRDVSSGNYRQAEFAADLDQVHRGEGEAEYRDPKEFFHRTFLTGGLTSLLVGALKRLSGNGGDPVVELQTNFGGGKTHSMLALYHLFAGGVAADFAGIDPILAKAGVEKAPRANRAVLVGTALSPGQPSLKKDGTKVNTLWGELAWQLGGKKGFARVAEADANGVSPGSQVLLELFRSCEPCLVLIDEWVAFVRQLYGVQGLPAGSFDANLSFAQSLTEAAKVCKRTLVVASLPASQIEIGGEGGEKALERLQQTFARMEATWRPASADEGFEIVRRRLFEPIADTKLHAARDAVIRAFGDLYRSQAQEFPSGVAEAEYRRRLELAYPIHPELFDRLYGDWSTLDKFQRTRGVLRLMAAVIHGLWSRDDRNLLILPAMVPVDDSAVQFELARHLDDGWDGVIGRDVDGPNALPGRLDRDNPNLGRYAAARRVARTLFLATAPTSKAAHPGIEPRSVNLGCVQPGETVATFGDALRRLSNDSTYLYVDGARYWYSTQTSVTQLAKERADDLRQDAVHAEIIQRLRRDRSRGSFAGVHVVPESSAEVPDEQETRLVVLGPEHPHTKRSTDSAARKLAEEMLARRGTSPRLYQNALVFIAPEERALDTVESAARQYLAWKSIAEEHETLNLTAFAKKQAEAKRDEADRTVHVRIPEAWAACLVPHQTDPAGPIEWQELAPKGDGSLAERVSSRLENQDLLFPKMGAGRLRHELDRYLWKDADHLSTKKLAEYLARYLYLPRLRDKEVLAEAIQSGGILYEQFGYADAYDDARGGYQHLRAPGAGTVAIDSLSVLVKPDAAKAWLELEEEQPPREAPGEEATGGAQVGPGHPAGDTGSVPRKAAVRRFHGSIRLDPERVGRDAGNVAEEVIQHLVNQTGATVKVTLEIQADLPQGASEGIQRTVTENCNALRFESGGFESE